MKGQLIGLIVTAADELNGVLTTPILIEQGEGARLYGYGGALDSLGLVNLLGAVEEAIEDEFEVSVSLADEKALSQESSPFRTIGSLAEYAGNLIREQGGGAD